MRISTYLQSRLEAAGFNKEVLQRLDQCLTLSRTLPIGTLSCNVMKLVGPYHAISIIIHPY
jgi:hypothetical protein